MARMDLVQRRYLDLLKMTLTRSFPEERLARIPPSTKTMQRRLRSAGYRAVNALLKPTKLVLVQSGRPNGESMLGVAELDNIEDCIARSVYMGVPGDVLEAGVWRGGASIFIRAALDAYGGKDRQLFACDSFEGLPKPAVAQDAGSTFWEMDYLAVSVDQVKANFQRYGLLDDRTTFIKGFFSNTIPTAPVDKLCVLRVDGDMYESTYVCLQHLYPKVSPGGFVIVDDYDCVPECAKATEDYRREQGITAPMHHVGWGVVSWQKA